jgi:[protein-PII] uridylyltransferase
MYTRAKPQPLGPIDPKVLIDNDVSYDATIVEVHASDAIGALYRVTRAIAEFELDIRSAKVQTLGAEAVDSFYVRDAMGGKVTDPSLLRELERAILHSLNA